MPKKKTTKKKATKKTVNKAAAKKEASTKKETCPFSPTTRANKKELENQNKILLGVLLVIGSIFLIFILIYSYNNLPIKYKEIVFDKQVYGQLKVYHTQFPVMYNGQEVPYNLYFRTNPRELYKVPYNGNRTLMKNMVLDTTSEFVCDGDEVIAIANLEKMHSALGINVILDSNATCDTESKYSYISIYPGEKTEITQEGSCYNLTYSNCEILKVTEKLIAESLISYNNL